MGLGDGSGREARSIDEMQSTMCVNDMSIEKFAATRDALILQEALSKPDFSVMTSQIAAPKIYHDWNQGMGDGR